MMMFVADVFTALQMFFTHVPTSDYFLPLGLVELAAIK